MQQKFLLNFSPFRDDKKHEWQNNAIYKISLKITFLVKKRPSLSRAIANLILDTWPTLEAAT